MVKIEYGKSQNWYNTHCCYCGRKFTLLEDRVFGTAIFNNDEVLAVKYHPSCANEANIQQACEQVKRGTKAE